jgi:hypothetical protein
MQQHSYYSLSSLHSSASFYKTTTHPGDGGGGTKQLGRGWGWDDVVHKTEHNPFISKHKIQITEQVECAGVQKETLT